MEELEEYKKKVNEAIEKVTEAHGKFNKVYTENHEFESNVISPNKGKLTPEQKQKEQGLVKKLHEARKELDEAIFK